MVMRLALMGLLMLAVTVPTAAAGPEAEDVVPGTSELPGGNYRYPWELGPLGRIQTEAEWRAENPAPHTAVDKAIAGIQGISADDWADNVKQMRELVASGGFSFQAAQSSAQRLMLEAMVRHGTKEATIEAIRRAYSGVVDSAYIEYIKVEHPEVLEPAEPGQMPAVGSVAHLRLELQIWNPDVLNERRDEIDISGPELAEHVEGVRSSLEVATRRHAAERADDLEEDLITASGGAEIDQARVRQILEEMLAHLNVKIEVKGERPAVGSSCHLVFAFRGPFLEEPQKALGWARMRQGVAVWSLQFEVTGKYADTHGEELVSILRILSEHSQAFISTEEPTAPPIS